MRGGVFYGFSGTTIDSNSEGWLMKIALFEVG
jgi:hypothetical protein